MIALNDGFVYNDDKIVITDFQEGNDIFTTKNIFYGTKSEAIDFGLIFNED